MPNAPIAVSPPYFCSEVFIKMATALAVRLIRNGDIPIDTILRMICPCNRNECLWKRIELSFPIKWYMTNAVDTAIEITVAMAAPLIPILNQNMKIGSRITFITAPINIVIIAFWGYPDARIILLTL